MRQGYNEENPPLNLGAGVGQSARKDESMEAGGGAGEWSFDMLDGLELELKFVKPKLF